jgi:hypothetical protein
VGSRFHDSSQSTKTGSAPTYRMAFAVATKVIVGHSTRSPGPTPCRSSARWSAAVPDESATAWPAPTYAASSVSKASTCGPSGAIQFESNASRSIARSSGPTSGGDRKIRMGGSALTT